MKLNLKELSGSTQKKFYLFLAALVLVVSAFTHLYNIDRTFEYEGDEIRDIDVVTAMITTGEPLLLGPPSSIGKISLGPAYYYLMVPSLLVSDLNPAGPAIMVALFGLGTTGLLIYLGNRTHNVWTGLLAGLFYAVSPVMLYLSRSSWNPNVVPFFTTLLLIVYPFKRTWSALAFGAVAGIIFQLHYLSFIIPILLLCHDLVSHLRRGKTNTIFLRYLPIIFGFILTTFPFWVYEFTHGFINSYGILNFFFSVISAAGTGESAYLARIAAVGKNIVFELIISETVLSSPVLPVMWIASTITLALYFFKTRGLYTYLTLGGIVFAALFNSEIHTHYLAFLFPLVCLIIGRSLTYQNFFKLPALILAVSLILPFYLSFKDKIYLADYNPDLAFSCCQVLPAAPETDPPWPGNTTE